MDFITLPVVAPLAVFAGSAAAGFVKSAFELPMTKEERDLKLARALETDDGEAELQKMFKQFAQSDGKVSKDKWAKIVREKHSNSQLAKYFGSTNDEVMEQFDRVGGGGKELDFDMFFSGVMTMGATIKLANGMTTEKGTAELKALFDGLAPRSFARVPLKDLGLAAFANPKILKKYFAGVAGTSDVKRTDAAGAAEVAAKKAAAEAKAAKQATGKLMVEAMKATHNALNEQKEADEVIRKAAEVTHAEQKKEADSKLTVEQAEKDLKDAEKELQLQKEKDEAVPAAKKGKKGKDTAEAPAEMAVKMAKQALEEAEKKAAEASKAVEAALAAETKASQARRAKVAAEKAAVDNAAAVTEQLNKDTEMVDVTTNQAIKAKHEHEALVAKDNAVIHGISATFKRLAPLQEDGQKGDEQKADGISWAEFAENCKPYVTVRLHPHDKPLAA